VNNCAPKGGATVGVKTPKAAILGTQRGARNFGSRLPYVFMKNVYLIKKRISEAAAARGASLGKGKPKNYPKPN
jgi:hypothetical protein